MSLASLNAKIRSTTMTPEYRLPVEIGLGVDGERLGAALAHVGIDRYEERFAKGELEPFQFLGLLAHFTSIGLSLLQEELRFTREGRSPSLVAQFGWRSRDAFRTGVLAYMNQVFCNLEDAGALKREHAETARLHLPAMLGAHLFPGEPHPFTKDQTDAMIRMYANLEVLVRANLQERAAAA